MIAPLLDFFGGSFTKVVGFNSLAFFLSISAFLVFNFKNSKIGLRELVCCCCSTHQQQTLSQSALSLSRIPKRSLYTQIIDSDGGEGKGGGGGGGEGEGGGEIEEEHFAATAAAAPRVRVCSALYHLPPVFWLYALTHTIYIGVFHLLNQYLPMFLIVRFKENFLESGLSSSMNSFFVIILLPIVGIASDRFGRQISVCLIASAGVVVAYCLLRFTAVNPLISLVLLGFGNALIPFLTLSAIPLSLRQVRKTLHSDVLQRKCSSNLLSYFLYHLFVLTDIIIIHIAHDSVRSRIWYHRDARCNHVDARK